MSFGFNCALGAKDLRPHLEELSKLADCLISVHPNAGLPNAFGGYDEPPEAMAAEIRDWAESGLINIAGGCCGTSPDYIRAIAQALQGIAPRQTPQVEKKLRLSGLEACNIGAENLFVNVGERTNVTGSKAFARMILEGRFDDALAVARQQVENGAQIVDINMDEAMLDSVAAMSRFVDLVGSEPDICKVPLMLDSSKWEVIEAGLKRFQGKCVVNSISMKEGEAGPPLRGGGDRHGLRRTGPGRYLRTQDRHLPARLRSAGEGRLPGRGHHLRPEHLRDCHRHCRARQLRGGFHQCAGLDQGQPAVRTYLGRRVQRQLQLPRQRRDARSDPHRLPLSRGQGRAHHGHRQCRPARRL
jgi:hypothetical protein